MPRQFEASRTRISTSSIATLVGDLGAGQDRGEVTRDERDFGIRLCGIGGLRIVAGAGSGGADIGQKALRIERRDFCGEIAGRQATGCRRCE